MFDTHCHIDLYPDPARIVAACEAREIYTIGVTTTPSVFPAMERLAKGAEYVRPAVGLHPELVAERWRELPLMWEAFSSTRYVGEVGLDYTNRHEADKRKQREVFTEVLSRCDEVGDKVLTVHSRRAADDVVDAIPDAFRGTIILHWFSGSLRSLSKGLEKGCYFSVNPAMVESKRFGRLVQEIPKERLLLETDGPFVTMRQRPANPEDVLHVARRLSRLKRVPKHEFHDLLLQNFRRALTLHSVGTQGHAEQALPAND